ncbi:MAG: amidohydrolase family protein [Dehalococcoidia bacterium]
MKIWDVHVHFPINWQQPDADPAERLPLLADALQKAGIVRASLLSGGRWGLSHEQAIELLRPYAPRMVPVAVVDPEETSGDRIRELHAMGYRGLKMIGVKRPYDEPDYFPVYAAAEELRMPILLHLGVIGGPIDYARTHPRRDAAAAQRLQMMRERMRQRMGPRDVSATRMHPFHLDTIANNFPGLPLIGAHMGGTGNYDAASSVARWRHNVHFDLSGGESIEQHAVERGLIGREIGVEKLVWGSDCGIDEIQEHVDRFVTIFDDLGLSEDEVDRIWYRNAAEMFGEETPQLAEE